ncbi:uncharacterized protein [Amphiura filiformis]|uniref:uncharacterized protein n=1 Tax=Amphiura filiformis TaxID=82378 RepID=UPI003B22286D
MHVLLECPERYKLFSNKTHREEIDANRDAAEVVETTHENVKSSNPVDSSPTTCTDVNIENLNKQIPDIVGDEKRRISTRAKALHSSNEHASFDDIRNKAHGDRAVVCKICGRRVSNRRVLKKHEMTHKKDMQRQSETGQFECSFCFNRYDVKKHLSAHTHNLCLLRNKQDYVEHTCSICLTTFENEEHLSIHQRSHVVHVTVTEDDKQIKLRQQSGNSTDVEFDEVKCEGLDKNIGRDGTKLEEIGTDIQDDIETNMKDDSKEVEETQKVCSSCNVEFTSTAALKEHQKRVSLTELKYPQQCPMCSGNRPVIVSECQYLQHKKQFKLLCQFCGKHFKDNKDLERHIKQLHNYQNKKECPGCHGIFGRKEYMQHVEYNRKEVECLDRKCLSCGRVLTSPAAVNSHAKHYNIKCNICWQHFQDEDRLTEHRKQYHNVYNTKCRSEQDSYHWCKHCDKFFEKASLLSAHVKSVLEEESSGSLLCSWEYKYSTCLRCGVSYTKDSDYRLHKFNWRHECHSCHQHFQRKKKLKRHYQHMHASKDRCNIFRCKYCGQSFDTFKEKIKHKQKTKRGGNYKGKFPLPCEDCNEMLDTVCQLDVHRARHGKLPAIVSCRFCRGQFTKITKGGIYLHSYTINEKCAVCDIQLHSTCQKRIHKKTKCHRQLLCMYCGAQHKTRSDKNDHENGCSILGQARCSVCCVDLACCQITDHRQHVEDRMKGKCCAYCLEAIPSEGRRIPQHQKLQDKPYLCSCGVTIEAKCQKKLHGGKFVCCKCGAHYGTYQDLIAHLVKYNICNVSTTNTAAKDNSELVSKRSLIEIATWNTVEEEGKTIYVCLYCGDKVNTYEEMMEHKSTFKYECPQCKKHFRTPLAASHHFKKVNHETAMSEGRKTVLEETEEATGQKRDKTNGPTGMKKREACKVEDDILTQYWQQSVCDWLYKREKESEPHTQRSTVEFQIGFEEYSIFTNTSNVNEDIVLDENEAQRYPVSSSNEIPVMASNSGLSTIESMFTSLESSFGTIKSILTSCEAKSVEPQPAEEWENDIKVPHQAIEEQYTCIHCKKQFISSYLYERHLASEDQDTKGVLYACTKCDRSFDVVCGLEYHIACMCKHCGMHYSNMDARLNHEQQCINESRVTDCSISSALSKDERECALVASVKELRSWAVEDEELTQTAVGTDDASNEETGIAPEAEGMEVVSRNEVEEKRQSVHSNAVKGGTPTEKDKDDDVNTNFQIVRTVERNDAMMDSEEGKDVLSHQNDHEDEKLMTDAVETHDESEGVEFVSRNEVEEGLSSVQSKHDNVDTQTEKENDDVNTDFEIEKRVERNDAMMVSEEVKEVISHQYDHGRKSSRVRIIRKSKELSLIMSSNKPVTRKCNQRKRAVIDENKCEFCLKMLAKVPKVLYKNHPSCCQNDESLKWMRCVCLHCNLELPTKCHINFHLDRVVRCTKTKSKQRCGKHFITSVESRRHFCYRCEFCGEISFGSKNGLEKHKNNWHKPFNANLTAVPEATNFTTKSGAAERIQPVCRKQKQDPQAVTTKSHRATKAIGEETHTTVEDRLLKVVEADGESGGKTDTADEEDFESGPASVATKGANSRPLVTTKQVNSTVSVDAKGVNSRPQITTKQVSSSISVAAEGVKSRPLVTTKHTLASVISIPADTTKESNSSPLVSITEMNSRPAGTTCTTQGNSILLVTSVKKTSIPAVTTEDVNSAVCVPVDTKRKQNASTSVPLANAGNPSIVTILPGGLETLTRIERSTEKASIRRTLYIGEEADNHFVECVTINNQSYLTFNYPASHKGILTIGQQSDKKFYVLVREDQNSKSSGKMGSPRQTLVVDIGPHKVHTIEESNDVPGNNTYIVELINTLPVTSKEGPAHKTNVAVLPVAPKIPHIVTPAGLRQITQIPAGSTKLTWAPINTTIVQGENSRPRTTTKPVNSMSVSAATIGANSRPLVTTKQVTSAVATKEVNPSAASTNFDVLPGGLVDLANIELAVEKSSIRKTVLIGEEAENHFVECVTINNKSYLTFNYPASHKGILTFGQQSDKKFYVLVREDQNSKPSGKMGSPRRALVVDIGQHKVHTIEDLNDSPGNNTYKVSLIKPVPVTSKEGPTHKTNVAVLPVGLVDLANSEVGAEKSSIRKTVFIGEKASNYFAVTSKPANSTPVVLKEVSSTLPISTNRVDSRPLVTTKQGNSTVSVAAKGANSRPLITTNQGNLTVVVAAKGVNPGPPVTTKQVNSAVSVAAKGVNPGPLVTTKQVTPPVAIKEMNSLLCVHVPLDTKDNEKASTSRPLDTENSRNPPITNTLFSVVPGGLIGFTDILFDTKQASLTNTLLLGEKATNHFVEWVKVDNESYLKFNHPGNHTAGVITSCAELDDGKKRLSVTIRPNSKSEGPSRREALVVKIGQHKVHTAKVNALNRPIMHVYSVDLSL